MYVHSIPVIIGPTGIGKSSLALEIARELGGEIVSCDSRQIYRGMDIGTAKPTKEELLSVPHHLVDILDPSDEYAAGRWAFDADEAIHSIAGRGKLPIICGGTFFYFSALRNGFDMTTSPDREFRKEALEREESEGAGTLHHELMEKNPLRADQIHANDLYRIIRALQIERDGAGKTDAMTEFEFTLVELYTKRENLYSRINSRVDNMLEQGLYKEFNTLLDRGFNQDTPGLKCVGYREFFNYIEKRESFEEAVSKIKQNSRHYAKRQLTWLRNREIPRFRIDIDELDSSTMPLIESFRE